jgi:hypothetical protein
MSTRSYESSTPRNVAFLGLGVMGHPMAGHQARAGHALVGQQRGNEAQPFQLRPRHAGTGQHHAPRLRQPDDINQLDDILQPIGQPQLHRRHAHPGISAGEAQVALQRQFQPRTQAMALNGGHRRLGEPGRPFAPPAHTASSCRPTART